MGMRNIALEGKMKTVKTSALSKIVYLTLITSISKHSIKNIYIPKASI